ncbi:oxygenase MpaB family protein, partial [Streptomyces sp. NPDC057674]
PELRATPQARDAARFVLREPPLPWVARGPYAVLASNAVRLLPPWARTLLDLHTAPYLPEDLVRLSGRALTGTIRWAMAALPPREEVTAPR